MDLDEHVLPTALFSPSKAAAQRVQAQDWHTIDVWLSSKYQGRSVPTFERNEDTLKTLLELVAANERGDEERDLMWGVWSEGLGELVRGMGEVSLHKFLRKTVLLMRGTDKFTAHSTFDD